MRRWTERLHSLQVDAPEVTFVAGQFGRLALPAPPGSKEEMLGRPYSFVNPPGTAPHEFYFITRAGRPAVAAARGTGAGRPGLAAAQRQRLFHDAEVPAADVLWCLATGTGIGPFLSILRTADPWQKFGRVVLVHAVRHADELTYRDVDRGHRRRASRALHAFRW